MQVGLPVLAGGGLCEDAAAENARIGASAFTWSMILQRRSKIACPGNAHFLAR
jgi:hypothetical protein